MNPSEIFSTFRMSFLSKSQRWIRSSIIIALLYHILIELIPFIVAYQNNFYTNITLTRNILETVAFIAFYCFTLIQIENRIGNLTFGVIVIDTGEIIFHIFKRLSDFTLATTFWGLIFLILAIGLLFALFRILLLPIHAPGGIKGLFLKIKDNLKRYHYGSLVLLLLVCGLLPATLIISDKRYGQPITIQPQDYQIEFRVWAHYTPLWYENNPHGTEMLDQFNRHRVIIQDTIFTLRDANGNAESFDPSIHPADVNACVTTLQWFLVHYPQIRFQYYAFGIGLNSCGNYEGSIYTAPMLKRFVDVCRNYSLPNVVGVYTDWEGPLDTAPQNANRSLNGWHQALWTDAFAYTRRYFPNWTLSCCYPDSVLWDRVDGDDDLQYYQRYNIFNPLWDDYGPMVYRSCNVKENNPMEFDGSWMIYSSAKAQLDGALNGDVKRASMWLGCTGCGPYQNTSLVYEHGEPLDFGEGKGFDAFARDILILKHFRYPSISIFHAIDHFDAGNELTGFFHQYGYSDALDKLNETVNGVNSTQSFIIWSEGDHPYKSDLTLDYMLNFNRLEYLAVMAAFILLGWGTYQYDILWFRLTRKSKLEKPHDIKKQ